MEVESRGRILIRRAVFTLLLAALPAAAWAGQPTTITFQGRLHDISVVNVASGIAISSASDIIFVRTAEGNKYLALPIGNQRGDYDTANNRFYMLDRPSGDIFSFSKIDCNLINLDGSFFSAVIQDAQAAEIFSKPISIPSTEIPTDITLIDAQRIGYRTDGPSLLDTQSVPVEDEKVYVLTRQSGAVIELPTLTVPLKDADLPGSNTSVFVEWDALNQSFLLLQNQLDGSRDRNTDLRDRLLGIQRDGTVTGTVFFTTDGFNTPDPFFPNYSGNAGGVTIDPETNTIYIMDPSQRQIIVLTPRVTQITAVTPARGPAAGGTAVTLTGTNFPSDAQVFFDGVAATGENVVGTTQITCVTPAHALGPVNVTVTGTGIPSASPATLVGGFTYENTLPIAALTASPSRGPAPLSVNFNIQGVSDPDGTVATRVLDFGEGTPFTFPPNLAVITTAHTYGAEGTYTATLTVTDNLGGASTATRIIVVGDELPLVVRSLSIRAADTEKDAMTLKGEFVLPEDLDISSAEVSVGFAIPSAPALADYQAGEEPEFTENANGGQYDGELVPNRSGTSGRLGAKTMKFSYRAFKRPGVQPSTFTFAFSGKGAALIGALEKALIKPDGTAVTLTGEDATATLASFTVIVRIAAGADVLNFKKQAVVDVKPALNSKVTLRRR